MDQEQQARELQTMTEELENYLLDDRLFRTITVAGKQGDYLTKMTLGGMLERIADLQRAEHAPEVVEAAQGALERAQRVMGEAYDLMLAREAKSYADSWRWFLQSCEESPEECGRDYAQEVPLRLRLERLLEAGRDRPALDEARRESARLDQRLREIWQRGDAPLLESEFPREQVWWLFGRPAASEASA